jgi:hypothetical protein
MSSFLTLSLRETDASIELPEEAAVATQSYTVSKLFILVKCHVVISSWILYRCTSLVAFTEIFVLPKQKKNALWQYASKFVFKNLKRNPY